MHFITIIYNNTPVKKINNGHLKTFSKVVNKKEKKASLLLHETLMTNKFDIHEND